MHEIKCLLFHTDREGSRCCFFLRDNSCPPSPSLSLPPSISHISLLQSPALMLPPSLSPSFPPSVSYLHPPSPSPSLPLPPSPIHTSFFLFFLNDFSYRTLFTSLLISVFSRCRLTHVNDGSFHGSLWCATSLLANYILCKCHPHTDTDTHTHPKTHTNTHTRSDKGRWGGGHTGFLCRQHRRVCGSGGEGGYTALYMRSPKSFDGVSYT